MKERQHAFSKQVYFFFEQSPQVQPLTRQTHVLKLCADCIFAMVSALLQKLHLNNGKAQSLCTGPLSNKICSTPNFVDHFSSLTTFLRLRTIVLTIKCKKNVNPKWPLHYSISNPCMEIVEQGGKKQCAYKILCGRLDRCDLAAPGHSDEAALTSQPSLLYYT